MLYYYRYFSFWPCHDNLSANASSEELHPVSKIEQEQGKRIEKTKKASKSHNNS